MASQGPEGGSDWANPVGPQFGDPNFRISGLTVWSGQYVDALQLEYTDKINGTIFDGTKYGGGGGGPVVIKFGTGENLTSIAFTAGNWINTLTFFTSNGDSYQFGTPVMSLPYTGTLSGGPGTTIYDLAVGYGSYLNNLTIFYQ